MNWQCEISDMNEYLATSDVIDFDAPNIQAIANKLSQQAKTDVEIAKKAYEFVRDNIAHSCDINGKVVTCEASSVLRHQEGICFAKSHLLAAILRCMGIPAGFCYQRLVFHDDRPNYLTLHGLNAIYLNSIDRWIRVDARGNKKGVRAEFCLDRELLAYPVRTELAEIDYPNVYAQPNHQVVSALKNYTNLQDLLANLPSKL
ncbi:transglutaminase family protein [Planktothrix sp. FACHB-1355]|uniref:Transglutaminase family protein n=1 Tax=Aerosakkonema funiforme FACHB-1375 TaxID=2949571 RepID=A0A926ZFG7_9CYAN|nr:MULTISPECIES: transglutaminase family protein [Oscillatoriales]MBD2180067.1 transglutaminase family protein [Aerosakkonema funiforme FACHB-1375]MBD3560941.1 transglutaminase family protein [Planktothrix sp. FACHB-1355]